MGSGTGPATRCSLARCPSARLGIISVVLQESDFFYGNLPCDFAEFQKEIHTSLDAIYQWAKKCFQPLDKRTDNAIQQLEDKIRREFTFCSFYSSGIEEKNEEENGKGFDIRSAVEPVYNAIHSEFLYLQQDPMTTFPSPTVLSLKNLILSLINKEVHKNDVRVKQKSCFENYLKEIQLPESYQDGPYGNEYNQIKELLVEEKKLRKDLRQIKFNFENFLEDGEVTENFTCNEDYENAIERNSKQCQIKKREIEKKRTEFINIALKHFPELVKDSEVLRLNNIYEYLFKGKFDVEYDILSTITERTIEEYTQSSIIRDEKVLKVEFAGESLVLKKYFLGNFKHKKKLLRELGTLKKLAANNDDIIQIKKIIFDSAKQYIYLEMPYFERGNLQLYIEKYPDIVFDRRRVIMKGVANGIEFLHNNNSW